MDPALIRRAQSGDVEAFTALVAGRFEPMQRTAMAILGQEADARDAVAESLAAIWRELPRLRDPLAFDTDLAVAAGVGHDDVLMLLRLACLHQLPVEAQ